ncbi:hypothetical protein [Spirosoma validum]|uniref:Uncharacterized protein n=1 Tax=Spirosoma validum TaxID=2771355 RepID=A0A927AZL9_9BACT|nr:hypothetical protein [Spirosoma validum]MBD2752810.1 hypothetical protein [Spirosoma validum]
MSVSSKSRKESTESFAAQAMHNTMGIPPALAQLNDKNLDNELPSRVADSNDTDVPGDAAKAEVDAEAGDDITSEDIEESKRASWGQAPVTDDDSTTTDANWNQLSADENVPATRANEPERTLGNA